MVSAQENIRQVHALKAESEWAVGCCNFLKMVKMSISSGRIRFYGHFFSHYMPALRAERGGQELTITGADHFISHYGLGRRKAHPKSMVFNRRYLA